MQNRDFGFLQIRNAVGRRFKVVHQMRGRTADRALNRILRHAPRHVGRVADAVDHRTGHAEASRIDTVLREQECGARLLEAWKRGSLVDMLADCLQLADPRCETTRDEFWCRRYPRPISCPPSVRLVKTRSLLSYRASARRKEASRMRPQIVIARGTGRLDSRVGKPTAISAGPCLLRLRFASFEGISCGCIVRKVDDSSRAFLGTFDGRKQHPFSELVY